MAIEVIFFHDTGDTIGSPVRGRNRIVTGNNNWGSHAGATTIIRSPFSGINSFSLPRYLFARITTDQFPIAGVKWVIEADADLGLDSTLFYDQRDTYAKPFQTDLTSGMTEFTTNPTEIIANVGPSGPENPTTGTTIPADSTYFTNYLLTQVRVTGGTATAGTTSRSRFGLEITEGYRLN